MQIREVEWDIVDFEGVDGQVHAIRQCSLRDRAELQARFNQLQTRLTAAPADATLGQLYDQDSRFQWLCDRCLMLCGIAPDWVSIEQLQALLFAHIEGDRIQPGYLIELNFPQPKSPQTGGKAQTYEDAIAILSTYTQSLTEAIDLANSHPSGELFRILAAKRSLTEAQTKALKQNAQGKTQRVIPADAKARLKARFEEVSGGR